MMCLLEILIMKEVIKMKGRQESDNNYERRIKNRLNDCPRVIKDYMISISSSTASTRFVYLGYIINFISFLKNYKGISGDDYDEFKGIRKMDIDYYMESIKINPNTGKEASASIRNAKLAAINSFFAFLLENEIINKNPCSSIKKVKDNKVKTVTYLTIDEVETVKKHILLSDFGDTENPWRIRDYAIFILGCCTGLRNSAIREIDINDIDFNERTLIVTEKDNVTKTVFLSKDTCDALAMWIKKRQDILDEKSISTNAVFISNQLKRMTSPTLNGIIKKYTFMLGKHITPHKMRSTCAMNLYNTTGDIYLVAQQLGHKNIENTQIYAKATENKLKEAAELIDKIYN